MSQSSKREVSEVLERSDNRKSFSIPTNELAVVIEETDREDLEQHPGKDERAT